MEKTADTLTDSKRGTAQGAKNELQDKLTINVNNEDSKWKIRFSLLLYMLNVFLFLWCVFLEETRHDFNVSLMVFSTQL